MINLMADNLIGFLFRVEQEENVQEGTYMRVLAVGTDMVAWYNVEDKNLAALSLDLSEKLENLFQASPDYFHVVEAKFSAEDVDVPTLH